MKKKAMPAAPAPTAADERVGFSFYERDTKALRDLIGRLRERHMRVPRTYLVRALAHVISEDEMFAQAVARFRQEKAGKTGDAGEVDECLAFNLLTTDVDKLGRVSDKLADGGYRGGRSFIVRALVHTPWELDGLIRGLRKFQEEFPDPRTRAGRSLKSRG